MRVTLLFVALSLALAQPAFARPLAIEDVRQMAFDKGIVKIKKVKLDHGFWLIKGDDTSGHEIQMKIEARSGQIVKLKRN
jgi:hypothetical protein